MYRFLFYGILIRYTLTSLRFVKHSEN